MMDRSDLFMSLFFIKKQRTTKRIIGKIFTGKNKAMNSATPIGESIMVIAIELAKTLVTNKISKLEKACESVKPNKMEVKTIGKISPPTQPVCKQTSKKTSLSNTTTNRKNIE